jgi:heme O synthase-like polyprenyltransferase
MTSTIHSGVVTLWLHQFFKLAKPRVLSLIVFTTVIGMLLATPGMVALSSLLFGAIGIALVGLRPPRASFGKRSN